MDVAIGCGVTTFDMAIFSVTALVFLCLGWYVSAKFGGSSSGASSPPASDGGLEMDSLRGRAREPKWRKPR